MTLGTLLQSPHGAFGGAASRPRRGAALVAISLLMPAMLAGCSVAESLGAPRCSDVGRTAIVAQSVPSGAYVPCLSELPIGWEVTRFAPTDTGTEIGLLSDRAPDREVVVRYRRRCDVDGASPVPPRTVGGRTYLRVDRITPRYKARMFDVFPGGCVTYDVAFKRGPHIALMDELRSAIDLVPRRELRLQVRRELGEDLDP